MEIIFICACTEREASDACQSRELYKYFAHNLCFSKRKYRLPFLTVSWGRGGRPLMLLTACVLTLIERKGIQKTMMPALSHSKQKGKEKSWKRQRKKESERAHPHTHEYKTCLPRNIKDTQSRPDVYLALANIISHVAAQ